METRIDIKPGDLFHHFKGRDYAVICVGRKTDDTGYAVTYVGLDFGDIWCRDLTEFMSCVDHSKYPEIAQKWRFDYIGNVEDSRYRLDLKSYLNRMHPICRRLVLGNKIE